MEPIRIIVAEDCLAYAEGIRSEINSIPGVKVMAIASDGRALIDLLQDVAADIIFMDIQMPHMNGIEATKLVTASYPGCRVIALTMLTAPYDILDMFRAGARGYLNKNSTAADMQEAIAAVRAGEYYYCRTTSHRLICLMAKHGVEFCTGMQRFTTIERQIIRLICQEMENEQIMQQLFISSSAFHRHLRNIWQKMNVKSKIGIVVYAMRYGLDKEEYTLE